MCAVCLHGGEWAPVQPWKHADLRYHPFLKSAIKVTFLQEPQRRESGWLPAQLRQLSKMNTSVPCRGTQKPAARFWPLVFQTSLNKSNANLCQCSLLCVTSTGDRISFLPKKILLLMTQVMDFTKEKQEV